MTELPKTLEVLFTTSTSTFHFLRPRPLGSELHSTSQKILVIRQALFTDDQFFR